LTTAPPPNLPAQGPTRDAEDEGSHRVLVTERVTPPQQTQEDVLNDIVDVTIRTERAAQHAMNHRVVPSPSHWQSVGATVDQRLTEVRIGDRRTDLV
jgi:hypothetical protein